MGQEFHLLAPDGHVVAFAAELLSGQAVEPRTGLPPSPSARPWQRASPSSRPCSPGGRRRPRDDPSPRCVPGCYGPRPPGACSASRTGSASPRYGPATAGSLPWPPGPPRTQMSLASRPPPQIRQGRQSSEIELARGVRLRPLRFDRYLRGPDLNDPGGVASTRFRLCRGRRCVYLRLLLLDLIMLGAAWQCWRVHFLRNEFSVTPKGCGDGPQADAYALLAMGCSPRDAGMVPVRQRRKRPTRRVPRVMRGWFPVLSRVWLRRLEAGSGSPSVDPLHTVPGAAPMASACG